MKKILVITAAAMFVTGLAAPKALAQRDAGAKARGDMSPYWSRVQNRTYSRPAMVSSSNSMVLPGSPIAQPAAESYRSFSYVPASPALGAGDEAIVTGGDTKMMRGEELVGTIPRETKFTVIKEIDGWLGAIIELDGKTLNGWIRNTDARLATSASNVQPTAEAVQPIAQSAPQVVTVQPQTVQEFRNFSYQPAQAGSRATQGPQKPAWAYPKTDPRRYRP